jgi:hypothetical protein
LLDGCGTVDLVSVALTIKFSDAKQTVKAGFKAVGSKMTLAGVSMKQNGVHISSTSYNYGDRRTFEMVPEDTLSTQIRPIPSDRPTIKFMISVGAGVTVQMDIRVRVIGMRQHSTSLN